MAVMGQNLALNIADNEYKVAIYNRSREKTEEFVNVNPHQNISPYYDLNDFVQSLDIPRKILLMIKSGKPVDDQIRDLTSILDENDLIIDGGNSHYKDTERRYLELSKKKIHFIGAGISGGEDGARYGPSIMPGGSILGWATIEKLFLKTAAKADDGTACCTWLGPGGAGHFVKMVHNGIEYGDMQLISEIYQIMRDVLKISYSKMADIFRNWNKTKLNSYLIEITGYILQKKDDKTGKYLVSQVLDVAKQKGTGRWTVEAGLDYSETLSLIAQAVFQRTLSSNKEIRKNASRKFITKIKNIKLDNEEVILKLENALYLSKILSYAQGFQLLKKASEVNTWGYQLSSIASIWQNGCIIRSSFLGEITQAYKNNIELENLIFAPYFNKEIEKYIDDLREIAILGINNEISVPGLSSALTYFDGLKTINLPTNLIQAQRDFFGAHGYQRIDDINHSFHSNWK